VAVHDDGLMGGAGRQERVANPQHVLAGLVRKGDAGTDAGMDEQI